MSEREKDKEIEGYDKTLIHLSDWTCCLFFSSGECLPALIRMTFQSIMNQEAKVVHPGAPGLLELGDGDICVSCYCCFLGLIRCRDLARLSLSLLYMFYILFVEHTTFNTDKRGELTLLTGLPISF